MKKYDEDFYNGTNAGKMVGIGLAGVSFMAFILLVTLYLNTGAKAGTHSVPEEGQTVEQAAGEAAAGMDGAASVGGTASGEEGDSAEELLSDGGKRGKITSDELDFWGMYDYKEEESEKEAAARRAEALLAEKREKEKEEEDREEYERTLTEIQEKKRLKSALEALEGEEPSGVSGTDSGEEAESAGENNGMNTLVEKEDGSEEWVEILKSVPKNDYDFEKNLSYREPVMQYYTDGKLTSKFGVDVSEEQGDIDWEQVKQAGVEFAMIRVGSRSHQNGELKLDSKFVQNVQGALSAGIKAGITFDSQAATTPEAVEEANFVVGAVSKYNITYPVACVTRYVSNEAARTDNLSGEERTRFVMDFCETVKKWGYKPMVMSDKNWLTTKLDLTVLSGCDVWLSQNREKPDYPYEFDMWRYSDSGSIGGIGGGVGLNVSFLDYEMR